MHVSAMQADMASSSYAFVWQGGLSACTFAADTMDVVEMVLGGRVNKGLVTLIQQAGGQAVGLCGKDSGIIRARQMVEKEIGFVGEVTNVNAALLRTLADDGYIPVVASVAADENGQALNVNADIAAGEVRLCSFSMQQQQPIHDSLCIV